MKNYTSALFAKLGMERRTQAAGYAVTTSAATTSAATTNLT